MHLKYEDVNEAFIGLVKGIDSGEIPTVKTTSRNGNVLQIEEPVTITYEFPLRRVLFNREMDHNPFFFLYQSLWMLAGRNDVESLAYYNSGMREFSDDGETFNGAYGWRWRNWKIPTEEITSEGETYEEWESVDQLERIVNHLKEKPDSRRAVLEMWSVHSDLNRIDTSKDVCCNTHTYFSIRKQWVTDKENKDWVNPISYLDMTICNRSNDLIWGTLGANVVHFSFLQEYIANRLGINVGRYNQFSNNLHVYEKNWEPEKWLNNLVNRTMHSDPILNYDYVFDKFGTDFISLDGKTLDKQQLENFVFEHSQNAPVLIPWENKFLLEVAQPMCNAFHYHKQRIYRKSLNYVSVIAAPDWRLAAKNWITKRKINWEKKNGNS